VQQHPSPKLTRLPITANEFVLSSAQLLWAVSSHYLTVRRNIRAALDADEYELAAVQSRFSIQLGVRVKLAQAGVITEGSSSPFEALARNSGKDSAIYRRAIELDRVNPITREDVHKYTELCHEFVQQYCDIPGSERCPQISEDSDVDQLLIRMRDLTNMANYLGIGISWPEEDLVIIETIRSRIAPLPL
jgi:hypothetical protein